MPREPEIGGIDDAPLRLTADGFERIDARGARFHLHKGDRVAALDDEVDLAERGFLAPCDRSKALG